jgi:hypothetical protein
VIPDINKEFASLSGELGDKEAKITLAKFLRANLGFTTELISGIKLAPYQEIILKGLLNRNFCMNVWGRGAGKSFIASVYCLLQCIFEPNTKILIAGPTFRTARFIFNYLEKIVDSKGADLLQEAFGVKAKRNDQFEWQINGGSITAIPLNGEKIRGFRANVLLLDEYLLLPEDIVKTVLMPFLVAPQNIRERMDVREMEDKLIKSGVMKEEERMVFPNTSKMVALSSASYTFENLYKTYKEWADKIYSSETGEATYFISQLSYEALPPEMVDKTVIEEAQNGGISDSSFKREYCAQFTDGSDSYFSAKKMHECTIPDGQDPASLVKGKQDKKYILAIDPNMDDSPSADYFAMSVLELDEESKESTLVHCYAGLGNLSNHVKYFYYLLNNFDIHLIICDNAGADTFLGACNGSDLFVKNGFEIKKLEFDSMADGVDYTKELKRVKNQHNLQDKRIFFTQHFTSDFIRRGNEYLQYAIDYKKIWFASKISGNSKSFNIAINTKVNLELTGENTMGDLIDNQDILIYQTKKQCALIQVSSTSKGTLSFDLPQHMKRNSSPTRPRKDNYTTLMLANWASKCYYDLMDLREEPLDSTFSPIMIR